MPPVRPEPRPGLPPRIEREATPGLPPRIERDAATAMPPRIEREAVPGLPPRIERRPEPERPPPQKPADQPEPPVAVPAAPELAAAQPAPEPTVAVSESPPAYEPQHVRDAPAPADRAPELPGVPAVRPDPLESPVRNVVRSHQRLAYIVLAVLVVGLAGFWVLRVHQRIGQTALEQGITKQEAAPTVQCAKLKSNGSAWACAVVYQAESKCLIARVGIFGGWSTAVGQHRCARVPQLARLVPASVTATMVAADVGRQAGHEDFVCNKLPSHKVRWACERPLATGGQCLVVRVIVWTPWNVLDGGHQCAHDPELQKALKRATTGA
jgi:hypothetical protein